MGSEMCIRDSQEVNFICSTDRKFHWQAERRGRETVGAFEHYCDADCRFFVWNSGRYGHKIFNVRPRFHVASHDASNTTHSTDKEIN